MIRESDVLCKVCGLGKIIILSHEEGYYKPVSWREHWFKEKSYFQALGTKSFWEIMFVRRKVLQPTHTVTHLHCNVCGVQYKFLPKHSLETPKSNEAMFQEFPRCYVGRKSTSIFAKQKADK